MHFEDFVLQLDASARGGFRARVVKSPFGEGAALFALPIAPGLAASWGRTSRDLRQGKDVPAAGGRTPLAIGAELYRAVFRGKVRTLFDKSLGRLERSPELGLRLKVKLDLNDIDAGALAELPWELLCDGETDDFFALSRQTSLVRYLDVPRFSQPIHFTPPLRILAVCASPLSLPPLDLAAEARQLGELNVAGAAIEVQLLENASAGMVRQALTGDRFNVLHFMGHSLFDRAGGQGMLAFEGERGDHDLLSGRAFAATLKDLRALGVVVLNACNTALAANHESGSPFRGVGTALVLGGVPAVVAMQRPISDRSAIAFSAAFYRHLARGDSIDEALTEGRQAIHSGAPETFEWAVPVLFLRIPEGNVFVARPAEGAVGGGPLAPAPARPLPPRRPRPVRVVLGYSGTDQPFIALLAEDLCSTGSAIRLAQVELKPGDSLIVRGADALTRADLILACLSENSIASDWVTKGLAITPTFRAKRSRSPVLLLWGELKDTEIPAALASQQLADFRHAPNYDLALSRLARCVNPAAEPLGMVELDAPRKDRLVELAAIPTMRRWTLDYLIGTLPTRSDPTHRYWTYIALAQIGGQRAETAVAEALFDVNAFARGGAEEATEILRSSAHRQ